jgi:transcriptional regulator with XRE-family HTH domain
MSNGGEQKERPVTQTRVNVASLYAALDAKRASEGRSWRDVAQQLGLSASTFTRMAQGSRPDVDTFTTLLSWIGMEASAFTEGVAPSRDVDPQVQISAILRSSDRVSAEQADALDNIMKAAYRSIVEDR